MKPLSLYRDAVFTAWISATAASVSDQVRLVSLSASAQAFEYDAGGQNPAPASATFTATARNVIGIPFYEFLVDGVSQQSGTGDSFTYTPPASIVDLPELVTTRLREGSATGLPLAEDFVTTFGLRAGGTTLQGHLSNQTHNLASDSNGTNTVMTGSGTAVEVFFGATRLMYDGAGASPGTYRVLTSVQAGVITPGALSIAGPNAQTADHRSMLTDVAVIRFAVLGQDTSGTVFSMTLDQSLSKVRAGTAGQDGDDGTDGQDGISPLSVHVDNPAAQVPANAAGNVQNYTGSGCTIEVLQGAAFLQFTTASNLAPGQWRIYDTDVAPNVNDLVVGAILDSGHEATVLAHTAMSSARDTVTIGYDIQARTFQGAYVTLTAKQTVSKSKEGGTGPRGLTGTDGADGTNGQSVAQIKIYRRASGAPSQPTGGSFDFSTMTLTPPAGWSAVIPAGSDPLYVSLSNASVVPPTSTDNTLFWTLPVIETQNGADGAIGQSTFQASIFQRATTPPSTPFGGSFNFTSNLLTAPSGWNNRVPSGSNPVWTCTQTFSIPGDSGINSGGQWSVPVKYAENGADGLSTYQISIFRRSAALPPTPTGGSYSFGSNSLSTPGGWFQGAPPAGNDPVWMSTTLASYPGPVGVDSTLNWSTPRLFVANGNDGTDGAAGDTKITGSVFYQTLRSTRPAIPSASGYSPGTGTFIGLSPGWGQNQPTVDITDTSLQEWRSDYVVTITAQGTTQTSFTTPTGAIQVASVIQSDNFNGNPNGSNLGTQGWSLDRNSGTIIVDAAYIRGTLTAQQIDLDGNVLTGGSNGITITSNGVTTDFIRTNATSMPIAKANGTTLIGNAVGGGYQLAAQVFADVTDVREVTISWAFEQGYLSGLGPAWGYRILRSGQQLKARTNMVFGLDQAAGIWVDQNPGVGLKLYQLYWWSTNDPDITAMGFINLSGLKR
jgi:hypothetical protein